MSALLLVAMPLIPACAQLQPASPRLDSSASESAPPAKKKKAPLQGKVERSDKPRRNSFKLFGSQTGKYGTSPFQGRIQDRTLRSTVQSSIGIIGVKFVLVIGDLPRINRVFAETPAAEAGIHPRDVIIAVDGVPTAGLRKDEIYDMIVGTPGTPVTVSIQRGDSFKAYTLTRMDLNEISDPLVREDYLRSM